MINLRELAEQTRERLEAEDAGHAQLRAEIIKSQHDEIDKEKDRIAKLPNNQVTVEEMEFYKNASSHKFIDHRLTMTNERYER
jgi:hypothetical protein